VPLSGAPPRLDDPENSNTAVARHTARRRARRERHGGRRDTCAECGAPPRRPSTTP